MKINRNGILSGCVLAVAFLCQGTNGQVAATAKPTKRTFTTISIPPKPPALQKKVPAKTLPISTKAVIGLSMVLAFNSGMVNGACLSGLLSEGTKQATAAVTGAWTNSALGLARGNSDQFLLNAKCIASYLGGSLISGLLVHSPTAFKLDIVNSIPGFALSAGLLATASSLAGSKDMNYLFLCCIANGIQNSLTSTLTGNLCRTAHFSGITSDIGTFLGQVLRGNNANMLKLKTFALLAASFWTGGYLSFGLTETYGSTVLEGAAVTQLLFAVALGLKAFGVI
jgi:uncharacterized membrane protein YoaK (UPF0700 family)